jgi:hypothetical protein
MIRHFSQTYSNGARGNGKIATKHGTPERPGFELDWDVAVKGTDQWCMTFDELGTLQT